MRVCVHVSMCVCELHQQKTPSSQKKGKKEREKKKEITLSPSSVVENNWHESQTMNQNSLFIRHAPPRLSPARPLKPHTTGGAGQIDIKCLPVTDRLVEQSKY